MLEKNNFYKIAFFIVLAIFIVSLAMFYINKTSSAKECSKITQSEEMAMVDAAIYDWGYNKFNDSELLFDYWIYNYGDIEAKNIKVRCKLWDSNQKIASSSLHEYGNLASKSGQFGEFTPLKPSAIDENEAYSPVCYVESCDNCEILYKRIPDLVKSLESD